MGPPKGLQSPGVRGDGRSGPPPDWLGEIVEQGREGVAVFDRRGLLVYANAAAWATGLIDNALAAAGTSAAVVGTDALAQSGVVYTGLRVLGEGAVLAGMVLGAIAVFMIDRRFLWAAGYAAFGAALASIGLIHGSKVEFFADVTYNGWILYEVGRAVYHGAHLATF